MKQKTLISLLLCIVLFLAGCDVKKTDSQTTDGIDIDRIREVLGENVEEYRLIRNGETIATAYVDNSINEDVMLPLFAILRTRGAVAEWQDDHTALISFKSREYVLDSYTNNLTEKDDCQNEIIVCAGGTNGIHSRVIDDEFFINRDAIVSFLTKNGIRAKIYNDGTVKIE